MKRILSLLLAVCLLSTFCACSSRSASNSEKTEPATTVEASALPVEATAVPTQAPGSEESQGITVDENLLTVEVTIPASFFEDETPEEIQAGAVDSGMISCTINDDSSVTYKMSKAKHRELMASLKEQIDSSIDDMLHGDEAIASFQSVKYNNDMSEFNIYVDKTLYSDWDSFYMLAFYMLGGYYQAFDGVPSEDIDVIVKFIDQATEEVLDTGSYKSFVEANAS